MHRRRAFADWPLASQNLAYADVTGTIGWQLVGRAPVRKKGHGLLPLACYRIETTLELDDHPSREVTLYRVLASG